MSAHYAVPHLFRCADDEGEEPAPSSPEPNAAKRHFDAEVMPRDRPNDRELYGEEEGTRVLYQLAFLHES